MAPDKEGAWSREGRTSFSNENPGPDSRAPAMRASPARPGAAAAGQRGSRGPGVRSMCPGTSPGSPSGRVVASAGRGPGR